MTNEKKKAATKAKIEAEAKVKAEAEAKAETEAKTKADAKTEVEELIEEAKRLGLQIPKLSLAGLRVKDPKNIAKEEARQAKQMIHLLKVMIAKAKANAKMKPIDKRRALLIGRMRAVKARDRAHTYTDANIKAWLEELTMIDNNPKSWNKITKNGTVNFTPGNKKKRTARDILDEMDLEDKDEE